MKSTRFFTTLGLAHAFLTLIQAQGTELFSPYTSGELRDTNNCLQNVESINFFACEGDVLNLDGCHPESYGDTRMRLYLESSEGLIEVNENDDYCGTISSHRDFEVTNPGCNLYRLDLGCYRDNTCGIKVTGECIGECHQLPTAAPTQQPIASASVSTFPFYHVSNQLHDTMMALENVESVHFYACGGDMLDLDACGDPQSMGDSYMRLYINDNNGWDFVDESDDFCDAGTASFVGYTVNAPGCHEYRLDLGCYDMDECSVGVHGSCYGQCVAPLNVPSTSQTTESVTAYPTMEPTSFPFTYHSGALDLTHNALYNVESVHFQLCGAQDVYLNACNENTLDDSYLRLYREDNGHDVLVAENDDYCDLKSRIHYGLPPGEPCHSYRLDLGCYGDSKCEVQVDAYCDGCPTPEPTKAPTPAGTVYLYYDDSFQCSDWYKRKGDKHHMELEAYNYLCVALDQCTPIGDANIYMKATLHYNTATYTDYQNSQYWDSPAPFTITYYPDANCMYPIADVASDCSNNAYECCTLGSATIMGESLSTIAPSGKVPAVFTWPDDCSPLPLLDAHEVDDWQMSENTLPFQAQVYAKHIQRVEEALHRGHNNFGLSSPRISQLSMAPSEQPSAQPLLAP